MNEEPVYEYVKGEGWIPSNVDSRDFVNGGSRWRVLARHPYIGELCMWSSVTNHFYVKNGKPNLDHWLNYFEGKDVSKLTRYLGVATDAYTKTRVGTPLLITVVPL